MSSVVRTYRLGRKSIHRAAIAAIAAGALGFQQANATTITWTGTTSNAWEVGTNWSGGTPPGSTSSTTNADIALFNTNVANNGPVPDLNRNIAGITFDTASVGAYTVGTTAGNALILSAGGTITATTNVANNETVNAPLNLVGSYTISNNSNNKVMTIGGAVTGLSASAQTLTLSGNAIVNNVFTGSISDGTGGGTVALTKSGLGNWVLSATNSYSGNTTINGGNLAFASSGAIGGSGASVTVNAGGAVAPTSAGTLTPDVLLTRINTSSAGTLALASNSSLAFDFTSYPNLALGASTTVTYSGAMTPGASGYRFGGGGGALTVSTALSGASTPLTIGSAGATGTVLLSNNTNSYGGATTINGGALSISNNAQLGNSTSINVTATGAQLLLASAASVGSGKTINITGSGVASVGALSSSSSGTAIWAGNVNVATDQARIGVGTANGVLDVQGVISGVAGAAPVFRSTNNTAFVQLSNTNTYTGTNTQIVVGGLRLNHAGALPSTTGMTFGNNSGQGTGSILDLNGISTQLLGIATVSGNNIAANITSPSAAILTVGNSTPTAFTYGDTVTSTTYGNITGAISLAKIGTNTQTLAGLANTYTGGTTITGGGTLALSSTATLGTSDVSITPSSAANSVLSLASATPGASGTIADSATVTLNSVVNGANTFYGQLAFGGSSLNEVVGTLIVDGVTKPAATYNATSLPNFITGSGTLTVTAPEPASAGLLTAFAAAGLLRRRRRK